MHSSVDEVQPKRRFFGLIMSLRNAFLGAIRKHDVPKCIFLSIIAEYYLYASISSPSSFHGIDDQLGIHIRRDNLSINRFELASNEGLFGFPHLSLKWTFDAHDVFDDNIRPIHTSNKPTSQSTVI